MSATTSFAATTVATTNGRITFRPRASGAILVIAKHALGSHFVIEPTDGGKFTVKFRGNRATELNESIQVTARTADAAYKKVARELLALTA